MPQFLGVGHVGIRAKDPQALAVFYRDVMDMTVTGGREADPQTGQSSAFLSSQPDEENHDLAIFTAPLHHVAFKVASLADLQSFYRENHRQKHPDRHDAQPWLLASLVFSGSGSESH
jgi:catechol-2,3-dioxygenase